MDNTLRVHIDFKSPYAYLAIEPTRQVAHALGITIDWYPFVLDIPSYLGSARLDSSGRVAEQSRSKDQWSGVKYAYYDCRRYANLRGLTIRGTEKIWDSNLAAIGMLWARRHSAEVLDRYIDGIYAPFWKRELNIEDIAVIEQVLAQAGADLHGFRAFAEGEGLRLNQQLQIDAFDSGIFGVPTFQLGTELYFGREHLPRVSWALQGRPGPGPDIANMLLPGDIIPRATTRLLEVGIDPEDYQSQLAIPEIQRLENELEIDLRWYAIAAHHPKATVARDDDSRGARHRRYRQANYERDALRYGRERTPAGAPLPDIRFAEPGAAADWAGAGKLGTPTFRLGEEVFAGRQHLPLIRAMLALRN